MAKKYKLQNYVVEALQIIRQNDVALVDWLQEKNIYAFVERGADGEINRVEFKNQNGNTVYGNLRDYVVISEQNELLTCSPEVFESTYSENLSPTPPVGDIHISDVIGLTEIFEGQNPINDISIVDKTYRISQLMDILNYENETIYVRKNTAEVITSQNGYGLTPFNSLKDAIASVTDERNKIQVLDSSSYEVDGIILITTINKFVAPHATIVSDITLRNPNSYIEIGEVEGNITIHVDCTLIIKGELKGTITILDGVKPYIRIGRVNETLYPLTLTRENVLAGSTIGSNQYAMKAL